MSTICAEPIRHTLRAERIRQGYTHLALADRIGCAPSTLWCWEAGVHPPKSFNLAAWAQALGVNSDGWEVHALRM